MFGLMRQFCGNVCVIGSNARRVVATLDNQPDFEKSCMSGSGSVCAYASVRSTQTMCIFIIRDVCICGIFLVRCTRYTVRSALCCMHVSVVAIWHFLPVQRDLRSFRIWCTCLNACTTKNPGAMHHTQVLIDVEVGFTDSYSSAAQQWRDFQNQVNCLWDTLIREA